jgi:hypothetical protein
MEFVLTSGSKLVVSPSEFGAANSLKKALMKCAVGDLLEALKGKDKTTLLSADMTILLGPLTQALTDDAVEAAVFKCFNSVVYNGLKLSYESFNSPNPATSELARKDFHEICFYVAKVNCEVFFEQIVSLLKDANSTSTDTPKQL